MAKVVVLDLNNHQIKLHLDLRTWVDRNFLLCSVLIGEYTYGYVIQMYQHVSSVATSIWPLIHHVWCWLYATTGCVVVLNGAGYRVVSCR